MDVKEIKEAFQKIAGPSEFELIGTFDQLSLSQGSGPLIDYQAGGGKAVLRENHPVAALYNRSHCPGKVYFLLSALISVINKAEADYKDNHEREFHSRLIDYLLQTP